MERNLIVKFRPDAWHDSEDAIHTALFMSRMDVFSPGFYVKKLAEGLYEINLSEPPSNWMEILKEYGKVQ